MLELASDQVENAPGLEARYSSFSQYNTVKYSTDGDPHTFKLKHILF
jgi:hypothetical protein